MSDQLDETQSHNSGNEEQGTEDNQKVEDNSIQLSRMKIPKILHCIDTCKTYKYDLGELEKLKLSTLRISYISILIMNYGVKNQTNCSKDLLSLREGILI